MAESTNAGRTKHMINNVETAVRDNLLGLARSHEHMQLIKDRDIIVWKDRPKNKVAIISGGGSGHEPYAAGYVGDGMLTGAVAGQIFASPSSGLVYDLIELLCKEQAAEGSNAGVLVIGINYTGDRLTFGAAVEKAKINGYNADAIFCADDVAFYGEKAKTGARGLAGSMLMLKIGGALAKHGKSLSEIKSVMEKLRDSIRTLSVSLTAANVPGRGLSFALPEDQIEIGLGIHGEAGISRIKVMPAKQLVKALVSGILTPKGHKGGTAREITSYDRLAVVINNLGGLSVFEMNIVAGETLSYMTEQKKLRVERVYVGTYCTSFGMGGFSVSILPLDDDLLRYLDEQCSAPAWHANNLYATKPNMSPILDAGLGTRAHSTYPDVEAVKKVIAFGDEKIFINCVKAACQSLVNAETQLNDLDREAGDGDCGSSLAEGAKALLAEIDKGQLQASFANIMDVLQNAMGGTSGGIYALFFSGASQKTIAISQEAGSSNNSPYHHNGHYDLVKIWSEIIDTSLAAVQKYSGAAPGDRTMVDALHGLQEALKKIKDPTAMEGAKRVKTFEEIISKVKAAAQSTAHMKASAGRAAYVNAAHLTKPDPGAMAVAIWLEGVLNTLKKTQ